MTTYRNEISSKIIDVIFTEEELKGYKSLTTEHEKVSEELYKREQEARIKLEGTVIGELHNIRFNYMRYNDTFYISAITDIPPKKWYEFWK